MHRRRPALVAAMVFLSVATAAVTPAASAAADTFVVAGWLPYWEKRAGALAVALNLEKVDEVSLFSYEVNAQGKLSDALKLDQGFWPAWLSAVKDSGTKIVPTVAWFDGPAIHKLLSNGPKRRAHEDAIAKLVVDNGFDGIDIDYEAKLADTIDHFSTFIYGLALRLHPKKKMLSCTIEARMPPDSRYEVVPENIAYANDYVALNKYCDQVRIMAYDQGLIDIKLNATKGMGKLYAPVSDPAWAEKVVAFAAKTIDPKKIMLGIPTYGYEYQVTWADGATTYERLRSVNFTTAMERRMAVGSSLWRNSGGELSFVYPTSTVHTVAKSLRWTVSSTYPADLESLARAGTSSASAESRTVARFLSFPDRESVSGLVAIAKAHGLRGVALFKFDGRFDPFIWDAIE